MERQLGGLLTNSPMRDEWCIETWGAGVDILTVNTHSSLFHFRAHFLIGCVPINDRYDGPIKWYLTICNTEPCTCTEITGAYVLA